MKRGTRATVISYMPHLPPAIVPTGKNIPLQAPPLMEHRSQAFAPIPFAVRRTLHRLLCCIGMLSVLLLAGAASNRCALAGPQVPPRLPNLLRVHVIGLRNDHGDVRCSLFSSAEGFPSDSDNRSTTVVAQIANRATICTFAGIAPGVYAIVLFHDENADGIFNRNWLGLPEEGYGFSNNARVYLRPPSFKAASFSFAGGTLDTQIKIRY
jgi:uncharacterized protein (DUF2141 family)